MGYCSQGTLLYPTILKKENHLQKVPLCRSNCQFPEKVTSIFLIFFYQASFFPDPPVAFFGAQEKTALFLGGFSSSTQGFQPEEASGSDAEKWMLEGDFLVGVLKGGCSRGRGATGETLKDSQGRLGKTRGITTLQSPISSRSVSKLSVCCSFQENDPPQEASQNINWILKHHQYFQLLLVFSFQWEGHLPSLHQKLSFPHGDGDISGAMCTGTASGGDKTDTGTGCTDGTSQ